MYLECQIYVNSYVFSKTPSDISAILDRFSLLNDKIFISQTLLPGEAGEFNNG